MNSSTHDHQEVDQPKQENGIGRSYECVFCKRGFNTAQALGGHMNIHRKERSKNRPSQTSIVENNGPYHAATAHPAHSSTSTTGPFLLNGPDMNGPDSDLEDHNNNRQCLNLFGLSLQFGAVAAHDNYLETMEKNKGTEDDLDLELRLGHDP
ncbi:hypothetical protein RND71_034953 [Anisodus tanguticus]|uniref:C2H2-type domain-containing protein n=1 Tax=Anisodus tanguticus TaxID=243964 RepID=A0AAE1R6R1_9SOLA|nr:hypothetical protein RND71_034953 [Anisodus tanguticus]